MNSPHSKLIIFYYFLLIIALFVFLKGFFPGDIYYSESKINYLKKDYLPCDVNVACCGTGTGWLMTNKTIMWQESVLKFGSTGVLAETARDASTSVNKLVLMVIDGMRYDFIAPSLSSVNSDRIGMPFLQQSILRRKTCLVKIKAAAPTVTMPRIKAMTSGTNPNYIDIVMNFGSTEFHQDTFIRQANLHGRRLVFYGDDTWLKMFPTMFARSAGVHSFYAADFWEVDANVTKKLHEELKREDWDVMILHYLGLDHIGHMEGPRSKHVPVKLAEMDDIIKNMHEHLQIKGSHLFLVTSDHGMMDSGGHGGVTPSEVEVPFISVGQPCRNLSGQANPLEVNLFSWPGPMSYSPDQIDLASTISVALGLPIPEGNSGKLIPAFLGNLSDERILQALQRIKHSILERTSSNMEDYYKETDDLLDQYRKSREKDNVRTISMRYYHELASLSEELSRQRTNFNLVYMTLACTALWILLFALILHLRNLRPSNVHQWFLLIAIIVHALSLASSSFIEEEHQTWYFLWATNLLVCLHQKLHGHSMAQSSILDSQSCIFILLCFLHISLRKLNQTGNKWAHLPDWGDYLQTRPECLLILYLLGLVWIYALYNNNRHLLPERLIFAAALMAVFAYRLSVASFGTISSYPKTRGATEAKVVFALISTLCIMSMHKGRRNFVWSWTLISALTFRPHNLVLIPAHIFVSSQVNKLFSKCDALFWNTLAHVILGNVFYYYQGHSSSISNIDVAPAMIGCETYQPVYGVIMTTIHMYSAPVLSFLLSSKNYSAILLSRLLPMTIYCTLTIFQRHHLFVWSVFSPKLLLESALTLVYCIVIILHKGFRWSN